jgi:(2Fe-2S) ferredoxin
VRYTELLIEAIDYLEEEWYTEYEIEDAKKIINGALAEEPDEHQIATLLSIIQPEENEFETGSPLKAYRQCLRSIKNKLKEKICDI